MQKLARTDIQYWTNWLIFTVHNTITTCNHRVYETKPYKLGILKPALLIYSELP